MAEFVHLELYANEERIEGESSQKSLGRDGTIECYNVSQEIKTEIDPTTGRAPNRRQLGPIKFFKRVDTSSPLILRALTKSETIRGIFRFYRTSPDGDGTTQHFYTIEIRDAHICRYQLASSISPTKYTNEKLPPMEEVEAVFHYIHWVDEVNNKEHDDSWADS